MLGVMDGVEKEEGGMRVLHQLPLCQILSSAAGVGGW